MPGYHQQRCFNSMQQPMGYRGGMHPNFEKYDDPDPNGEQFRKLFIGGLSFDTDECSLKEYFSKWGEITDCVVMREAQSKRSRGFGFITFKDKDSVDEVQNNRKHKVDGREVETKRAMPRNDPCAGNQQTVTKVFLGGVKDDTTEETVRSVFSPFGCIKQVEMIPDKNTGKIKGFCFVTFEDHDSADKCVLLRRVMLNSRKVEVKKAIAKGENNYRGPPMHMGQGPMPMARGGRGDYTGGYRADYDRNFYAYNNPQSMNGPFGPSYDYFNRGGYFMDKNSFRR